MSWKGNKMLRNANSDIGGLTQWIGHKCRNHNPLQQMKEQQSSRSASATVRRSASCPTATS